MDKNEYLEKRKQYLEFMNQQKSISLKTNIRVNYIHDDRMYECVILATPAVSHDGTSWVYDGVELVGLGNTISEALSDANKQYDIYLVTTLMKNFSENQQRLISFTELQEKQDPMDDMFDVFR